MVAPSLKSKRGRTPKSKVAVSAVARKAVSKRGRKVEVENVKAVQSSLITSASRKRQKKGKVSIVSKESKLGGVKTPVVPKLEAALVENSIKISEENTRRNSITGVDHGKDDVTIFSPPYGCSKAQHPDVPSISNASDHSKASTNNQTSNMNLKTVNQDESTATSRILANASISKHSLSACSEKQSIQKMEQPLHTHGLEPRDSKVESNTEKTEEEFSELNADLEEAVSRLECHEEEDFSEDEDEDFFDPFLFIQNLPKLEDIVPAGRQPLLPKQTRSCPPVTLVLDLDETLVHSTLEPSPDADFTFPVRFINQSHTIYVRKRPHLDVFMARVSQLFEIIVFTASQSIYADQLLNILDPKKSLIRHRVFRDSCVYVEGNFLKDLTVLGRDLARVAIIDNSPQAFGFQVSNGIPIKSWFDDKEDSALKTMLPFLESLAKVEDVRPLIANQYKLREKVEAAMEPTLRKKLQ